MNVYLCGQPSAAKQSVVECLASKGFKLLRPQDEGHRRPQRAGITRGPAPYEGNPPECFDFVVDKGDAYMRAPHPNLTVMLLGTTQITPTPHLAQPRQTTLLSEASDHPNVPHASNLDKAMRGSYVPAHDLVIDLAAIEPTDAARIVIERARAFWNDCNQGIIGPFRGDYFFLSNMFPTRVAFDGITYSCSESAYQAQKSDDATIRERVSQLDGKSAKRFMDNVTPRPGWDHESVTVMEQVLLAKFTQDDELRRKLASTSGFYLCELNHWGDNFFGVPMLPDGTMGHGLNMLGKALMRTRRNLCHVQQT